MQTEINGPRCEVNAAVHCGAELAGAGCIIASGIRVISTGV
jgi:hypothetical protein